MSTLSSHQRKFLRGLAHHLDPAVLIGKHGLTPTVVASADTALTAHELIKVRFNDHKDEKQALAREIESQTQSELCGMIGHVAIFYRQQRDPEKRKIELPA